MCTPSYSDLGKQARSIFENGYHFGLWKLDINTKIPTGIEFSTSGCSNQKNGEVSGSLGAKYRMGESGFTVTETWNTDNSLVSEFAVKDRLLNGLKLSLGSTFAPETGNNDGKMRIGYGQESFRVDSDFNIDFDGPVVNASAVIGYNGFLAGYETSFDSQKTAITNNNFSLGYIYKDCVVHSAVNNGQEFCGSIYQKCNDQIDCGVQVAWTKESNEFEFGVGAAYCFSDDASFRAKVNNEIQVGLGYQHLLRGGIALTLSTLIDVKKFSFSEQKIGCALEMRA